MFAVCPSGLSEEEAQALEKANVDFRTVPKKQRITLYWLKV